jgi:uncharacterized membrane protein
MSTFSSAAPAKRSQRKLVFFAAFLAATLFVTYMKNTAAFDAASPMAQHYAPARGFLVAHAFFGGLAILLGIFQFSNRLRARYLKTHRTLGYIYVISVFISAPLAIPVALRIDTSSLVAASAVQSFGWIVTTAIALYAVRHGNIAAHRRWMIRSYPFAMVFTVARLIIPIPPVMAMGDTGIEVVVWSTVAMAAFLPGVFLEWKTIAPRAAVRGVATS